MEYRFHHLTRNRNVQQRLSPRKGIQLLFKSQIPRTVNLVRLIRRHLWKLPTTNQRLEFQATPTNRLQWARTVASNAASLNYSGKRCMHGHSQQLAHLQKIGAELANTLSKHNHVSPAFPTFVLKSSDFKLHYETA